MLARAFVEKYLCEARWGLRLARARLSRLRLIPRADTHMQTSPAFQERQEILERQAILREILRDVPYWALGHVRLGVTELELLRYDDVPLSPRARATVRDSAEAAERLTGGAGRAGLEAEFLRASLDFLNRDFTAAAGKFARLLEPANSVQLHERVYRMAAENAAACGQVLG